MLVNQDRTAEKMREVYPYKVDLTNCDEEPLHHIQVIQSQTCLLAAGIHDLTIRFVSDNAAERIGTVWEEVIDRPLSEIISPDVWATITLGLQRTNGFLTLNPISAHFVISGERVFKNVIVYRTEHYLILEVEPSTAAFHTTSYQQQLGQAVQRIQSLTDYQSLFQETATIIRQITGYDRVMVYEFDEEYNGQVIAEDVRSDLNPFLGLHYPHTDIPKQAREFYLKNRIRIIGDTADLPARLRTSAQAPKEFLDLTLAHSRGVSPVHLEYLGNMGVRSSMSIAIVVDGRLWGLFAMHNYSAKFLDYNLRSFLLFIGQVFSGHLAIQQAGRYREQTLAQNILRSVLGEQVSATNDVLGGLIEGKFNLLGVLPEVTGAMVCYEDDTKSIGATPAPEDVAALAEWVRHQSEQDIYYASHNLGKRYEPAATWRELAAGVLLVFLDGGRRNYIVWFRPEKIQTIRWGGKPGKNILETPDGSQRLSPRKSFAQYVERVSGQSDKWTHSDTNAALALRAHIAESVLLRFTKVRRLNEELRGANEELETFSYTVSHDLRAPLRAIDGLAEIIAEDYGDALGEEGREMLTLIQNNVGRMNEFIRDILEMSRVGRASMIVNPLDVPVLLQSVLAEQGVPFLREKRVAVTIDEDFPEVYADERLLRQVFANLIANALKYGKADGNGEMRLHIGHEPAPAGGPPRLFVANSGSSVPQGFTETIFDMFSRADTDGGVEGTGIGLAIVKRIINRHGGDIWVDPNTEGAKFVFTLNASE